MSDPIKPEKKYQSFREHWITKNKQLHMQQNVCIPTVALLRVIYVNYEKSDLLMGLRVFTSIYWKRLSCASYKWCTHRPQNMEIQKPGHQKRWKGGQQRTTIDNSWVSFKKFHEKSTPLWGLYKICKQNSAFLGTYWNFSSKGGQRWPVRRNKKSKSGTKRGLGQGLVFQELWVQI